MRGVAEEDLRQILALNSMTNLDCSSWRYAETKAWLDALSWVLSQCQELNPWQPIESAPKDREIVVFAPGYQGLNPIVTICKWHESAGFCIDELRQPTLWMEVPK